MQSIQPGKNEPKTLIEGAPRQPVRNNAARRVNPARQRTSVAEICNLPYRRIAVLPRVGKGQRA